MKNYIAMNTLFVLAIYLGFYSDLDNGLSVFATGYAYFVAWATILIALLVGYCMFDAMVAQSRNSVGWQSRQSFDTIYDLCIILAFVGVSTTFAYVTAILYLAHMLILRNIRATAKKLNLETPQDQE
jgi:hypothetical protein